MGLVQGLPNFKIKLIKYRIDKKARKVSPMGRKKDYVKGYKLISVKVDKDTHQKFKEVVESRDTTITKVITDFIKRYTYRYGKGINR